MQRFANQNKHGCFGDRAQRERLRFENQNEYGCFGDHLQ